MPPSYTHMYIIVGELATCQCSSQCAYPTTSTQNGNATTPTPPTPHHRNALRASLQKITAKTAHMQYLHLNKTKHTQNTTQHSEVITRQDNRVRRDRLAARKTVQFCADFTASECNQCCECVCVCLSVHQNCAGYRP